MTAPSLRDMWLSECWPTCRELSREEREVKRAADLLEQERMAAVLVDKACGEVRGAA